MNERLVKIVLTFAVVMLALGLAVSGAFAGSGEVVISPVQSGVPALDYQNAQEFPLPMVNAPAGIGIGAPVTYPGPAGFEPGSPGTGILRPASVPAPVNPGGLLPEEYGTSNSPFTTSRVDVTATNAVSKLYPFSAAGKLYFKIGSATYMCSASLIKKGIAVTAAHCVANFGQSQWYSNWQYIPALYNTMAPYGKWNVVDAAILTSYFNGTDTCSVAGVVCQDDVAVLVIAPNAGFGSGNSPGGYPGTMTGWFGYGVDGYGFTPAGDVLVNQLGYPAFLNGGLMMERTDAEGFVSAPDTNNTVWGSGQTGGSSGGPELVNLGAAPSYSGGDTFGSGANFNTVIGVTSWGYTDLTIKQQGASPFLSTNIGALVNVMCSLYPAACAP